jgi:NAD(P)-dependent dehydrogenase (short-subunit alcohol dehydrogenase family)
VIKPKIAIVTGGGSGLGRVTALALSKAGWQVMIAGPHQDQLDDVCAESGPGISGITIDVTDEAAVHNLFRKTATDFGRIDLLFNNAGIMSPAAAVGDVTLEDWSRVIEVNVTGFFLCAREAFRYMAKQSPQGGRIINNGSISAQVPRPHMTPYTVSKHAITGLTRSLSLEGRALNIACGQIDIGNAATDMTEGLSISSLQADGTRMSEPTMDAENVANSIVHMANLPLDANVQSLTVMATQMPFIGRG